MANPTASDVSLDDIKLNGGKATANLTAAVTSTDLTQTISGASTVQLDLLDTDRSILQSSVCQGRTTLALDDLTFEIVAAAKQSDQLSLTFEDYAVACLRRHKKVQKAAAGSTSRVEFCRKLIQKDEPWIVVDGPASGPTILEEISTGQTSTSSAVSPLDTATPSTKGRVQLSALDTGKYLYDAGFRGSDLAIGIAVAHAESGFNATDVGHNTNGTTDVGLMQINSSHGYSEHDMFDPVKNTAAAYKLWKDTQGEQFGGWKQWSTYNNGAYKQYLGDAQTVAQQVLKGTTTTSSTTTSGQSTKPEDHWTAITRIMGEIQWRVFARRGHIVIAPDSWLLKQAGITISEQTDGVDTIDFEVDHGQKVSTVTVTCRADRWGALPGEPVTVTGMGPADDTWLLSQIARPLTSTSATVTLVKKQKALPEPASNANAGKNGTGSSETPQTLGASKPDVRRMVTWALGKAKDPAVSYLMGGNGPHQYDCSGFVVGATTAGGHPIAARTADAQYQLCRSKHLLISVQSAMFTCGALLFGAGSDGTASAPGHVAISLGNGKQTVQAQGTATGVGVFSVPDTEWSFAAMAPGFSY